MRLQVEEEMKIARIFALITLLVFLSCARADPVIDDAAVTNGSATTWSFTEKILITGQIVQFNIIVHHYVTNTDCNNARNSALAAGKGSGTLAGSTVSVMATDCVWTK